MLTAMAFDFAFAFAVGHKLLANLYKSVKGAKSNLNKFTPKYKHVKETGNKRAKERRANQISMYICM